MRLLVYWDWCRSASGVDATISAVSCVLGLVSDIAHLWPNYESSLSCAGIGDVYPVGGCCSPGIQETVGASEISSSISRKWPLGI